jgi:hypothetical protein
LLDPSIGDQNPRHRLIVLLGDENRKDRDITIEANTVPCGLDPFGQVNGGTLSVTGPTFRSAIKQVQGDCRMNDDAHQRIYIILDNDPERVQSIVLLFLVLAHDSYDLYGLILLEEQSNACRQIGMFYDTRWELLKSAFTTPNVIIK